MPNLQYIGARYVPKFFENPDDGSNDWKAGVPYEPLTVVTEAGDSYTSKIPVPGTVGAPSLNPTYWVKTSNYSASITALQNEISDINNLIGNEQLKTDDNTLTGAINELDELSGSGRDVNVFDVLALNETYFDTLLGEDASGFSMQGGCYDSSDNTVLLCFRNPTTLVVKLVKVSANDFTTVITRGTSNASVLGHANSATYNPNTNKFYIPTVETGSPTNILAVVNADTLVVESTKQLQPSNPTSDTSVWHITYDNDDNVYYARSETALQTYDENFVLKKSVPFSDNNVVVGGADFSSNSKMACATYYKGKYYAICWHRMETIRDKGVLIAYNPDDGSIFTTHQIEFSYVNQEPEFMFVKNDLLYICCGQRMYTIKQVILQTIPSASNRPTLDGVGYQLPDGYDVDNLLMTGKYYIGSNYANVLHQYIDMHPSFIFVIPSSLSPRITQVNVCFYQGQFIMGMRQFNASGNTWTPWIDAGNYILPVALSEQEIHFENCACAAYSSGDGKTITFTIPTNKSANLLNDANITLRGSTRIRTAEGGTVRLGTTQDINLESNLLSVSFTHGTGGISVAVSKLDGTEWTVNDQVTPIQHHSVCIATPNVYIGYTP